VLAVVLANGTLNALAAEDVVTVAAVDMAEVPDVSWFPPVFTPGRLMFAEPLKLTPPIVRAVCRTVADPAFPDVVTANVAGCCVTRCILISCRINTG
jgi:hypothetical protein